MTNAYPSLVSSSFKNRWDCSQACIYITLRKNPLEIFCLYFLVVAKKYFEAFTESNQQLDRKYRGKARLKGILNCGQALKSAIIKQSNVAESRWIRLQLNRVGSITGASRRGNTVRCNRNLIYDAIIELIVDLFSELILGNGNCCFDCLERSNTNLMLYICSIILEKKNFTSSKFRLSKDNSSLVGRCVGRYNKILEMYKINQKKIQSFSKVF